MNTIELFDKYINNELSDDERQVFDARLKTDKEFADDFKIYSAAVIGICREAEQDNKDFEIAMKNLSKEKLQEIVGKQSATNPKIHILKRYSWIWQAASFALLIAISTVCILKVQKNAELKIAMANQQTDNAAYLYACANFDFGPTRGSSDIPDITKLNDEQLKEKIPVIVELYGECDDPYEMYEYGYPLAMTYLRLHEREKAVDVLNQLIERLSENNLYLEELSNLKSIVEILK